MVGLIIILAILTIIVSYAWAKGISDMNKNYPDYKEEDFLYWDDDQSHTEQQI